MQAEDSDDRFFMETFRALRAEVSTCAWERVAAYSVMAIAAALFTGFKLVAKEMAKK